MNTATTALPVWKDRYRFLWILSAIFPLLIWTHLISYQDSGNIAWLWLASFITYCVLPVLDRALGADKRSPALEQLPELERRNWYRVLLVLFVPLQYGMTIHGAWIAAYQPHGPLGFWGWTGLILTVGTVNGVAINTAHELGHKFPRWERGLARIALAPAFYGHFYVEHNRGHHRRVATPEDPASARMGESFWAFLPRTLIGGLLSGWELEKARLASHGRSAWHWRNVCLQAWSLSVLFYFALCYCFGIGVLPFLLAQALYGASLLEVVNYMEHYGLLRQKDAQGRHERCSPEHSWNSSHIASNIFLYHLQRHSDHHAHPARRYQALRHYEQSPQLPAGYGALMMVAYIPPLWYWLMDRRVLAHYGGDLTKANLQPSKREALLTRFQS